MFSFMLTDQGKQRALIKKSCTLLKNNGIINSSSYLSSQVKTNRKYLSSRQTNKLNKLLETQQIIKHIEAHQTTSRK